MTKVEKLFEEAVQVAQNADNNTYALIIDYLFGNTMADMIQEELHKANEKELKEFIKEFSNMTTPCIHCNEPYEPASPHSDTRCKNCGEHQD